MWKGLSHILHDLIIYQLTHIHIQIIVKTYSNIIFFFVVPHVKVRFHVRDELMKIKVLKLKETIISVIISMTHSMALFLTFATSSLATSLFHFTKAAGGAAHYLLSKHHYFTYFCFQFIMLIHL